MPCDLSTTSRQPESGPDSGEYPSLAVYPPLLWVRPPAGHWGHRADPGWFRASWGTQSGGDSIVALGDVPSLALECSWVSEQGGGNAQRQCWGSLPRGVAVPPPVMKPSGTPDPTD